MISANNGIHKPDRLSTMCFYIAVGALQFEEFDIAGISVFQLIMLPLALLGIVFCRRNSFHYREFNVFFFLLLWLLLSCIYNGDWMGVVNKVLLIPYIYFIINYIKTNYRHHVIRFDWIFIWGPLLSLISLYLGTANYADLRFSGIHKDANFACLIYAISFVSKLCFFGSIKIKWKIVYALLMLGDIYLLLLTQSRGGLLALFFVCFLFLLFKFRTVKGRLLLIIASFFLVSTLFAIANTLDYWYGDNNVFTYALARFQSDSLERGSGRDDLWKFAINYLVSNGGIFIPVGYNNYRELTNFWSHNSYIDLALDATGVITVLFMLYLCVCFMSFYFKRRKTTSMRPDYDSIFYIGVAGCISLFFLSAYTQKLFYFSLMTLIIAGNYKNKCGSS